VFLCIGLYIGLSESAIGASGVEQLTITDRPVHGGDYHNLTTTADSDFTDTMSVDVSRLGNSSKTEMLTTTTVTGWQRAGGTASASVNYSAWLRGGATVDIYQSADTVAHDDDDSAYDYNDDDLVTDNDRQRTPAAAERQRSDNDDVGIEGRPISL